jgi:NTP pyrophosphatase (non-canonical NTP hydrolase)
MTLNEYQEQAYSFAKPSATSVNYMLLGLQGEVGELSSLYAKWYRDEDTDLDIKNVKKEIGDILWFVSGMCSIYAFDLEEIAQMNIDKLASRKERNVIGGSGDDR